MHFKPPLRQAAETLANSLENQKDMTENIDNFIEETLNLLKNKKGSIFITDFNIENINKYECLKYANILMDKKLVHLTNERVDISAFGTDIINKGGWFKYLETEKENALTERERQLLNDEKLKYDVKNSKRIFKTYWWTFTFSIIALIISLMLAILKILEVLQQEPVK